MISLRRAEARHHDRRHKREVWRIFDPLDGVEGAVAVNKVREGTDGYGYNAA